MAVHGNKNQAIQPDTPVDATPIAGRWRNAARIGFGGFFLAMAALQHHGGPAQHRETYRSIAERPGQLRLAHADRWCRPGAPDPAADRLRSRRAALVLSKGQGSASAAGGGRLHDRLAALMSWYELANLPLVAWALVLMARDYDRSLLNMVHRHHG